MLIVGVLHENVVGLIPHVGAVAIGAVGGKVGILVNVHTLSRDSLVLICFVESIDQLIHIAQLHGGVVFQNLNNSAFLQLSIEAGHDLLIQIGGLHIVFGSAVITAAGEQCQHHS